MIYAPRHIKKYLNKISDDNKFYGIPINSKCAFGYEVQCSCGNKEFLISKNSEPKVTAFCEVCRKSITLYDLSEYPCAKIDSEHPEDFEQVTTPDNDKFNVAVIFKYSDDIPLEEEGFDENNITRCQVYLYDNKNQQSIMIVDNETTAIE